MYYILDGHKPVPCDLLTWGKWLQDSTTNRIVSSTMLQGIHISTVFMGLDHSFFEGKPLLFETMVFGGPLDGHMDRYATWKGAEYGHLKMVQKVKEALDEQFSES